MAEYHFMTYSTHIQLCDGERARYGTTDPAGVSCDACKQTSEWQAAAKARGIEMPKDSKTTVEDLRRTANELLARAAEIEREEKAKAIPEEPRLVMGNMFKLIVSFVGSAKVYTYLLVRKPGGRGGPWYTTGTGDTGYFENWDALMAWLRSDNVAGHSALIRMDEATSLPHKPVRYPLGGKQR
jgi:hypothetical protein